MSTSADDVWAALAVGAVSSVGLLAGEIAGVILPNTAPPIAMAMSVGAGLLLAGVSLKVAADAIQFAGPMAAALSLLLEQPCSARATRFSRGSAPLTASDAASVFSSRSNRSTWQRNRYRARQRARRGPEAMVLGIALRDPVVPLALVIAFSVGNLPVAFSSTAGMRAAGRRYGVHLSALECDLSRQDESGHGAGLLRGSEGTRAAGRRTPGRCLRAHNKTAR